MRAIMRSSRLQISTPAMHAACVTALLFHSMTPSGQLEQRSLHEACSPLHNSVKYSMTKWIHAGAFSTANPEPYMHAAAAAAAAAPVPGLLTEMQGQVLQQKVQQRKLLDEAVVQARLAELQQRLVLEL
jgi:hypothetical protein